MDKRNIRGLFMVFISFIINLIGGVINMFVSGNTGGLIFSAIVIIASIGLSIYGLSQITGYSDHFRKARTVAYIYMGAELTTLIGTAIISANVSHAMHTYSISGYIEGYYSVAIYTIIFSVINAALNIFYITEILSGCMDIAKENNAPITYAGIFGLRRWYTISLTVTVACQVLILIIYLSSLSSTFSNYIVYGQSSNPVAAGFTVFLAVIEIIAGIIYIVSYIRVLMTVYKTYSSNFSDRLS